MTPIDEWLAGLEQRHLGNLTRSEVTRALRALSSCYVERRAKLRSGTALEGEGKRAAFALYYGPLHFLTVTEIVRALGAHELAVRSIADLGCGTGVGGAAWGLACAARPAIEGIDASGWAVEEANRTYRALGLRGRAKTGDLVRYFPSERSSGSAILLAYAINELHEDARTTLLARLIASGRAGTPFLIVESIARRDKPWWAEWADRLGVEGAREDEWRFRAVLPPLVEQLARSAGLSHGELTARSLARLSPAASGLKGE